MKYLIAILAILMLTGCSSKIVTQPEPVIVTQPDPAIVEKDVVVVEQHALSAAEE